MKISKSYIKRFKTAFLFWQNKFGLTQYNTAFFQCKFNKDAEGYAQIQVDELSKTVSVTLPFELSPLDASVDDGPEINAMHGAGHLLTARLCWIGRERYVGSTDIQEEDEAIVNRLVKVLSDIRQ